MSSFEANQPSVQPREPAVGLPFGEAAGEVLGLMTIGILVCTPGAVLVAANSHAAERLRDASGLHRQDGMLTAENTPDTAELRDAIRRTAETGVADALFVRRANGTHPLMIALRAIGRGDRRAVVVAVRDTGCRSPILAARVKALFRLAPAEADIVMQLAQGADLGEIAAARKVTVNTIRTQMASAMLKVGVNRQAELVATITAMDMPI